MVTRAKTLACTLEPDILMTGETFSLFQDQYLQIVTDMDTVAREFSARTRAYGREVDKTLCACMRISSRYCTGEGRPCSTVHAGLVLGIHRGEIFAPSAASTWK